MQEAYVHRNFACREVFGRKPAFDVFGDVRAQGFEVGKGLVFTPQGDEGSEGGVAGAGGTRIGVLDEVFVLGVFQVGEAFGRGDAEFGQFFGIDADAEGHEVDKGEMAPVRLFGEFPELRQDVRLPRRGDAQVKQVFVGRLQVWLDGAAVPHVRLRVIFFAFDFAEDGAGTLPDKPGFHAVFFGKAFGGFFADFVLHAAIDGETACALGGRKKGGGKGEGEEGAFHEGFPVVWLILGKFTP
ncbi:hypothetical protein HMPREF9080_02411 [Cardiobacterium valvarum F0432]|uniref:Uncharacterized protein n=1 Tax=Cardiobacterium valvarum F0432 TaxID=797473 RepID=G9ZI02_9GAMM|nr:hypothetical protein HMPREF9080_02411 [Cardiobacterium valvarum F0432]